jgi:hypothetical protein
MHIFYPLRNLIGLFFVDGRFEVILHHLCILNSLVNKRLESALFPEFPYSWFLQAFVEVSFVGNFNCLIGNFDSFVFFLYLLVFLLVLTDFNHVHWPS